MQENSCTVSPRYDNSSTPKDYDLMVYHYGHEKCKSEHYWTGVRDHYLLHYIISGRGTFIYNNESYHLREGQGFLICPNTLSYYRAHKDEPWEYCWVGFHGRKVQNYLSQLNLSLHQPIISCNPDKSIEGIVQEMIDTKTMANGRELILTGLLYHFFAKLMQHEKSPCPLPQVQNHSEVYVKVATDFIKKNYSRKITIEEIADYVGINRKYLSSLFRKTLNVSPQDFLINYRINRACVLLAENLLSITHVAHSVGYDDSLLFSKMFKKRKGMSPTQYRKRLMGNL